MLFTFAWYREWGGWTSNAFAATTSLCVILAILLVCWLGVGLSPDEHLHRLVRVRT
jgi:MFS transporter, DHA2 family, multidrug resistance protein